eukprot:gene17403-22952_t
MTEISYDRIILSIQECFVFKIPPLRAAAGYRAEEWDLENPLTTCFLRLYQAESIVRLVLFNYKDQTNRNTNDENLSLFAECIIEIKPNESIESYIDEVVDSSRYFVIKLKDPKSTRVLRLGIGFRERESAFDLRGSLNECIRYVNRMDLANKLSSGEIVKDSINNNPENISKDASLLLTSRDLTIKTGTKISLSSNGLKSRKKDVTSDEINGSNYSNQNLTESSIPDDEWGDFIS